MQEKIRKIIRFIPKFVCTGLTLALILWLTLAPKPVGDFDMPIFPGADKIVHAIMFGWLTLMFVIDLHKHSHASKLSAIAIILCALTSLTIGGLIEILQQWMNIGRGMEFDDFLADAVGSLIVAAAILVIRRKGINAG